LESDGRSVSQEFTDIIELYYHFMKAVNDPLKFVAAVDSVYICCVGLSDVEQVYTYIWVRCFGSYICRRLQVIDRQCSDICISFNVSDDGLVSTFPYLVFLIVS